MDENNKYYFLECSESYGSCYSGYTSAEYADKGNIYPLLALPPQMDKTKNKIFVEISDINNVPSTFMTTDGRLIFNYNSSGNEYYPSDSLGFNETLYINNPRVLSKKRIYVLSGISNAGKSTIAHKIWDKVLESDSENVNLSNLHEYDAIVIGNKNADINKAIYTKIKKIKDIDFIKVAFSNL